MLEQDALNCISCYVVRVQTSLLNAHQLTLQLWWPTVVLEWLNLVSTSQGKGKLLNDGNFIVPLDMSFSKLLLMLAICKKVLPV